MLLFDLHNDFPTALRRDEYSGYVTRYDCTPTAAVWTSELDDAETFIDGVVSALSPQGVPVAIEDLGFLCGKNASEFDFSRFLYCSLTWNFKNGFAGGALDDGALTSEGKSVIKLMNGKCAADLAHIGKRAFYSALDEAQDPICSHTGFADNPRCLDENQIRALVARRAPIGLCVVRRFSGASSAKQFAAVIDKFVSRYGNDRLCLGTDFYGSTDLPDDLSDYSQFDAVRTELERLGYGSCDIDKIFYLNVKRFCEEIHYERHLRKPVDNALRG